MSSKRDKESIEMDAEDYLSTELVFDGKLTPYGEKKYEEYLESLKEWVYDEEQGKWIHV